LDIPFRMWLANINAGTSDIYKECDGWLDIAKKIVIKHGDDLVSQAGMQAFVGRVVKVGNKEDYYSTPKVYGWFMGSISKKLNEKIQKSGGE